MHIHLPFSIAPVGDMFQREIEKPFQGLPNMFGIADDILLQDLLTWAKTITLPSTRSLGYVGRPT